MTVESGYKNVVYVLRNEDGYNQQFVNIPVSARDCGDSSYDCSLMGISDSYSGHDGYDHYKDHGDYSSYASKGYHRTDHSRGDMSGHGDYSSYASNGHHRHRQDDSYGSYTSDCGSYTRLY
jgi:hypothetical protein